METMIEGDDVENVLSAPSIGVIYLFDTEWFLMILHKVWHEPKNTLADRDFEFYPENFWKLIYDSVGFGFLGVGELTNLFPEKVCII